LAKDGLEALKLAKDKIFDLILSDLHMPLMEGDELIKNIRNKVEYKHTPFLFLSGDSNKDTWLKNLNAGADDFILKPFDPEILLSKVQANLKKFALRKEITKAYKKRNLSAENGAIILFKNKDYNLNINTKNIISTVIEAYDEQSMEEALKDKNIWLILIDENAGWIFNHISKLRELNTEIASLIFIISNENSSNNLKDYCKYGASNFIIKHDVPNIIESQINSFISRENLIKMKYFASVKSAANNSFIKFEYYTIFAAKAFDFNIIHQPYESIPGGDFYEIFNIDEQSQMIVVGDVMGKKWDAWFFVSSYISYIRSLIKLLTNQRYTDVVRHPAKLLENLNKFIYKDAQLSEIFTTLSILYLDEKNSLLRISSAGAQKPMFYDGLNVKTLNIIGTLMGIIEDVDYQELEIKFEKNYKLLLFTDGYNEASNQKTGEMLDNYDVLKSFEANIHKKNLSAKDIENHLIKENNIKYFDDDRTMLIINGR